MSDTIDDARERRELSQIDTRGRSVSSAITLEVASHTGEDVEDLPPLYEYVDPEALDRLVSRQSACSVRFSYLDFDVRVDSGSITIAERPAGETSA